MVCLLHPCWQLSGTGRQQKCSVVQPQSSGPVVDEPVCVAVTDVPVLNSLDSLLKEIDVLSTAVEHKFTTVVLSNIDYDTVLNHNSSGSDVVMTDTDFIARPLSVSLESTDLAGQHFLLHPACGDLFACLQHHHACKKSVHSCLKIALAVMICLFLVMMRV